MLEIRITGKASEIEQYMEYLRKLEQLGEVELIAESKNYPNRNSIEDRKYIKLEFDLATNEVLQEM